MPIQQHTRDVSLSLSENCGLWLAILCLGLVACAPLGPNYQRPALPLQAEWSIPESAPAAATSWWQQFDEVLYVVIESWRERRQGPGTTSQHTPLQSDSEAPIT